MDFTEIYKQTGFLVSFSPGTHFLLTAIQDRLVVRQAESFQIIRTWALNGEPSSTISALSLAAAEKHPIRGANQSKARVGSKGSSDGTTRNEAWVTHAGWSCDSEYVFGACTKNGSVEAFKMRDEEWRARIDAGAEGLARAEWAPDGRTIVCWSEWGLRVTIWSLVTGTATYIQYPAHLERGYAFRSDGHYLVLAERHKSRDTIGVYDATTAYRLVRHVPLPTGSLAGLALSPTGNHGAVWESPLEYKICILSLAGDVLGTFSPEPDPGFGVRTVAWHPSGRLLAVLGWDDKVHVLENLTWGPVVTLALQSRIPVGVAIWREPENWLESTHGRGFLSYERIQPPHTLNLPPRDRSKPPPDFASSSRGTVDHLAWNTDGTLLLVRYGGAPNVVWLYAFPQPEHAPSTSKSKDAKINESKPKPKLSTVLVHASPVEGARWNPVRRGSLAVSCGGGALYLWSDEWVSEEQDAALKTSNAGQAEREEVAECVGVPAKKFSTHFIRWAPDGRGLILLDRETFCCAFEVEEADGVLPQVA